MKYVAVGFRVDHSRSIFYIKEDSLEGLMVMLEKKIASRKPDFVSLRMIKET